MRNSTLETIANTHALDALRPDFIEFLASVLAEKPCAPEDDEIIADLQAKPSARLAQHVHKHYSGGLNAFIEEYAA